MTTQLQRAYGIKVERAPVAKADQVKKEKAPAKVGDKSDPYPGLPRRGLVKE